MSSHFTSFTAEAMRALGQQFADGAQARAAFRARLREQVTAMMEQVRREAAQAEQDRHERVARDADARRAFLAGLRTSVQALLRRFSLSRKERIAALHEMAGEYRAACQAFRDRSPGAAAASGDQPSREAVARRAPQPTQAQPVAQARPAAQAPGRAAARSPRTTKA